MHRRFHLRDISSGVLNLDGPQGHHLQNVLRLEIGTIVELFDDSGKSAAAVIERFDDASVWLRVEHVGQPPATAELIIGAAIPKGDRADWMIEKLSEIGVDRFIPLVAQRSIVVPGGVSKMQRWQRIATEAAKQSRRAGVMHIDPPMQLTEALAGVGPKMLLSLQVDASPLMHELSRLSSTEPIMLLIGPEGGWTDAEVLNARHAGLTPVRLTDTILRVETAAVAAATLAACWRASAIAK